MTSPVPSPPQPGRAGIGAAALIGVLGALTTAAALWLGLAVAPTAAEQGDVYRLIYVHVPSVWTAYLWFAVAAGASLGWLWPRTRRPWLDQLAGAAAEVGVVFCGLTLLTGMIWGRPTWGVYWTWDARLTSTALLFVMFVGYLVLRRVPTAPDSRARLSAVAALVAFANVPIVHKSVEWWRTLHQDQSITPTDLQLETEMFAILLLSLVGFTLLSGWLVSQRYRVGVLEDAADAAGIAEAIEERTRESAVVGGGT